MLTLLLPFEMITEKINIPRVVKNSKVTSTDDLDYFRKYFQNNGCDFER